MAVRSFARALAALSLPGIAGVACLPPGPADVTVQLLQANVGTALLSCDAYAYKLCDAGAEAAIAARIAAASADVLTLQEVLPDAVCDAIDDAGGEDDPGRTCHPAVRATTPTQAARLVDGATHDVRCDERNGFECVAVARSRARFVSGYVTAPIIEAIDGDVCDTGFTVGRVDVDIDGVVVRVINGHPQSTKDTCRRAQVEQIFGPLAQDDDDRVQAVIVAGDMNLDPFGFALDDDDVSVPAWQSHVGGEGADFAYASGPAEQEPPYPTTTTLVTATLDHVAVRGGSGVCTTLGAAPGTTNLDEDRGAMDHRALSCALTLRGDR
jgi:endonuclease/exonuclease/phosphatase family metal-dependent hydrolase